MALFKKKMKAAAVVPVSHEDIEFRPDDFTLCDDADAVRIDSNYASQSYWKEVFQRFVANKGALIALILISIIVVFAVIGPGMTPYTYSEQNLTYKNFAPRIPVLEDLGIFNGDEVMKTTTGTRVVNGYPHQFSGGQRQRVGIARALIMNPKLIIADECISALDVSIQAQVVNLMKDLQDETGTAYLFIAHDLSMVKYISDRIGVLHLGHLVETGTTDEIFRNPVHPYTQSLLSAIPHPNPVTERTRIAQSYDYKEAGVDYNIGTSHLVEGTHYVLATDEEFARWTSKH